MSDLIRNDAPRALSADPNSLEALKRRAAKDPAAAAPLAARQFEAIFLQNVMKSMREASVSTGDGVFDNANTKMMTSMLDQQYAQALAQKGTGLAQAIEKSILRNTGAETNTKGSDK